ncbi:hypothetical protein CC79DRAFT_1363326 [Sarocladium strictum]
MRMQHLFAAQSGRGFSMTLRMSQEEVAFFIHDIGVCSLTQSELQISDHACNKKKTVRMQHVLYLCFLFGSSEIAKHPKLQTVAYLLETPRHNLDQADEEIKEEVDTLNADFALADNEDDSAFNGMATEGSNYITIAPAENNDATSSSTNI